MHRRAVCEANDQPVVVREFEGGALIEIGATLGAVKG